jgi:hypothetical protein
VKQGRLKYSAAAFGALACVGLFLCLRTESSAAPPRATSLRMRANASIPAIDPGALPRYGATHVASFVPPLLDPPRRPAPAGEPLWQSVPDGEHTFAFPQARHVERGHPVRYDRNRVAKLEIGDALAIVIPGQGRLEFNVDRVRGHANGDQSVHGHLVGHDHDDYRVTLTQGATRTFANVQTPQGIFLLEAEGEQGWVFADTLDELIDHSKSDALFPRRN